MDFNQISLYEDWLFRKFIYNFIILVINLNLQFQKKDLYKLFKHMMNEDYSKQIIKDIVMNVKINSNVIFIDK